MRRTPALFALLAVLLGFAPSRAAAPPRFAGTTRLVSTIGPAGVAVSLPRAVTVDLTNPGSWIQTSARGPVGGVVLDGINRPPQARVGLVYTRLTGPAGCSLDGRCVPVEAIGVRTPGSATYARPGASTLTLPAGVYRTYVIGEVNFSGRAQSVTVKLPGLGGNATVRATQAAEVLFNGNTYGGLNDAMLESHPEHALSGKWSLTDGYWSPNAPAFGAGSSIGFKAPAVLAGGVWQSPATKAAGAIPASPQLSTCWQVSSGSSAGPPDFWYQDLVANHHYFTGGYTPRCVGQEDAGKDRAFGLARRNGSAEFLYRRTNPVIAPGQRIGWFGLVMRLLDAQ